MIDPDRPFRSVPLAVVDCEFTGLDRAKDRLCEVAVVRADQGLDGPTTEWSTLVRPDALLSASARKVTGLTDEALAQAPRFAAVADEVLRQLTAVVVVGHRVEWDLVHLERELHDAGKPFEAPITVDTLDLARRVWAFPKNNLASVCEHFGVPLDGHHRALGDARATYAVLHRIVEALDPFGTVTLRDLHGLLSALDPDSPKRRRMLLLLRESLRQRRTVILDYQNSSDPTQGSQSREVSIWALRDDRIQGWCHLRGDERVFRLDRIHHVVAGERHYEIPKDLKLRL